MMWAIRRLLHDLLRLLGFGGGFDSVLLRLVVECRNKVGVKAILGKINKKGKN